ncbi:MAG TPA: hypothetical protein VLA00_05350 [Xanthobacteraceae bacterium]|nr:hypothetical protein [Xanthobacteraceae bacterium]
MKRIVLALCALSFTAAVSGPVLAECYQGHASAKPPVTDSKGS